jgi:hypothetical protein
MNFLDISTFNYVLSLSKGLVINFLVFCARMTDLSPAAKRDSSGGGNREQARHIQQPRQEAPGDGHL